MSDLFWLTDEQMERLRPFFPKSHGKPRVDDRRVLSGIVFVNRNGLRWRDAPSAYGSSKTLYNRWKRWGEVSQHLLTLNPLFVALGHRDASTVRCFCNPYKGLGPLQQVKVS